MGGGTAGWLTAASLVAHFKNTGLAITVIESSAIGNVGVGEATIPSIRRSYQALGLSDAEVIEATNATAKLAIKFDGWKQPGDHFFHPFGLYGQQVNQVAFHHYWLKLNRLGIDHDISQYSLAVAMARAHKFTPPPSNPQSPLAIYNWALHFDATLFGQLMKKTAQSHGVRAVDGIIEQVKQHPETGFITELVLENGQRFAGDLFLDCSGFIALLIGRTLNVGYEDWSHWLGADTAIAVQSELDTPDNIPPYTQAVAHSAGWQWKIPLQDRQGNGHVYASNYVNDEQALEQLTGNIKGKLTTEPKTIKFQPGRRTVAWSKNCIALGLSAGFLEPLESTSIALIETAIEKIKLLFPDRHCDALLRDEFNQMTALEYERVRDFIILHYKLNGRSGEAYWQDCRENSIPDALAHKMALFKARGHLVKYRWEMFQNPSWLALYSGLDYLPEHYDFAADNFSQDYLGSAFKAMRHSIQSTVSDATSHNDFLATLRSAI